MFLPATVKTFLIKISGGISYRLTGNKLRRSTDNIAVKTTNRRINCGSQAEIRGSQSLMIFSKSFPREVFNGNANQSSDYG